MFAKTTIMNATTNAQINLTKDDYGYWLAILNQTTDQIWEHSLVKITRAKAIEISKRFELKIIDLNKVQQLTINRYDVQ